MKIVQIVSTVVIAIIVGLVSSCSLNPAEEEPEPIIVNFPDPNFETVIREILNIPTRNITNQDMWRIKGINGISRNISDISGIEYCTGLNTIFLQNNFITNIKPLSELVLLEYINLQDNQIVNILPLIDNKGLGIGNDIVIIYNNPLSDESILKYKPQLQSMGVMFYSNAELSAPGEIHFMDTNFETSIREHLNKPTGAILNTELESITNFQAQNRNISNIYGIEFCTNLETLDIGENQIKDLIPILYLREIKKLRLDNNDINDISSLRHFYSIIDLDLGNNKIADISYLSNLSELQSLILRNNNIQDISPISNLLNLKYLNLSGNPIDDFEVSARSFIVDVASL